MKQYNFINESLTISNNQKQKVYFGYILDYVLNFKDPTITQELYNEALKYRNNMNLYIDVCNGKQQIPQIFIVYFKNNPSLQRYCNQRYNIFVQKYGIE